MSINKTAAVQKVEIALSIIQQDLLETWSKDQDGWHNDVIGSTEYDIFIYKNKNIEIFLKEDISHDEMMDVVETIKRYNMSHVNVVITNDYRENCWWNIIVNKQSNEEGEYFIGQASHRKEDVSSFDFTTAF